MAQSRNRASRFFLAILSLTILVGVFLYLKKPAATPAGSAAPVASVVKKESEPLAAPAQPTEHVALAQGPDAPIVTATPVPSAAKPAAAAETKPATPATKPVKEPVASPAQPAGSTVVTPSSASPQQAITDAKAKAAAGEFLAARDLLNKALPSLSGIDLESAKTLLSEINQTVVFSSKRFADDALGGTYKVQNGDMMQKIAANYGVTWEMLCRINGMSDPKRLRAGANIKVIKGPFHAVVSKSQFRMDLYLGAPGGAGSMYVMTLPVGLGKSNSTPTGTWAVSDTKQKNPKFWGTGDLPPMDANDPKNPLGEFWIGLEGVQGNATGTEGYGIHGTIEPDSIGKQASHGCIRLRNGDIDLAYEALIPGKSTVVVVD